MNAPIYYKPNFITTPNEALKTLAKELDWEQRDAPRQEYYCNTFPYPYVYGLGRGRREYQPKPWHPLIKEIRTRVEEEIHCTMDVCFLNRYLNQSHHLGWHADDSPEMDDKRPIAIVSLGVEREIWFREKPAFRAPAINIPERLTLGNGSLCVMQPGMQETWQHRIPKCDRACGERVSLTFRGYVNEIK